MPTPLMDVVCYVGRIILPKFHQNLEIEVMVYGYMKESEEHNEYPPNVARETLGRFMYHFVVVTIRVC